MYQFYCLNCDKTIEKIYGRNMTRCSDCNNMLHLDCKICNMRFLTFSTIYYHLKTTCARQHKQLKIGEKILKRRPFSRFLFIYYNTIRMKLNFQSFNNSIIGTKNTYMMYCSTCRNSIRKVYRQKLKNCNDCQTRLEYQCSKCGKLYASLFGMNHHARRNCFKNPELHQKNKDSQQNNSSSCGNETNAAKELEHVCSKCGVHCGTNNVKNENHEGDTHFMCESCVFQNLHSSNLENKIPSISPPTPTHSLSTNRDEEKSSELLSAEPCVSQCSLGGDTEVIYPWEEDGKLIF